MLTLILKRYKPLDYCIIGELTIKGRKLYTLEPIYREKYGAIPLGTYKCGITFSRKFCTQLPLLFDVPGRSGIRIHAGNTYKNTRGCILLGTSKCEYLTIDGSKDAILVGSRMNANT